MSVDEGTTGTATTTRVLTAANLKGIINAHAPTKTGSGASGTWSINVTGSAGSVAWANVTGKPSTFTPSSHTHDFIMYKDTRSDNQSPDDVQAGLTVHLKGSGTDGLSDGGSYHAILNVKDWGDYSGGPYWQSTVTANNNMYFRRSTAGTTWGSWQKVLSDNNYTDYTVTKTGTGATGTWGISITGNAATATKATQDGSGNVITSKYVTLDTAQTISGTKTMTGGLNVSGRSAGGGDDEGIVVGFANNGYAGLCLGGAASARSVFYFKSDGTKPFWRYNDGSASYDISHPSKSGTIALTSDIPTTIAWGNITGKPTAFNPDLPLRLKNYSTSGYASADDATEQGFHYITGATSRPSFSTTNATDYRVLTTAYSNIWLQQIATDFRCNDIFYRRKENGTWKSWVQIQTTESADARYAKLASPNNLVHSSNEITMIPDAYSGDVYLNYRTASGNTNGAINTYRFCKGNGGDLASITASSFIGSLNGNASTATKLQTARTIQTNLASTSAASFDGSSNITPGVTGVLGPANGGTGQTTLKDACNSLINALTTGSSTPSDADYFVSQYAGGGTTTTTYHRRPVSALWSYIKGKADSVYLLKNPGSIEMYPGTSAGHGGFIDFHYNSSSADYTSRIIESGSGKITINGSNFTSTGVSMAPGNVTMTNGNLNISRSTTIAANEAARINFTITQTDNNVSSTSYIAVFDDLDTAGSGNNMVICSKSGVYVAAGEGAGNYLETNPSTSEHVHICADNSIYFHTNCNTVANATSSVYINTSGVLYGACWNDYAEYRICKDNFKAGQVVVEKGDDTLIIANSRLQRGCSIVSDTFGFAIGETDEAKCPVTVSGRVLAYGYESREEFKKHIGWPVCSGPNGTVSIMTEEEEEKYPSRIIGTISAVPDYETWGTGNIEVNNRIWIKIK